jgi:hypothetical protein
VALHDDDDDYDYDDEDDENIAEICLRKLRSTSNVLVLLISRF